jgi:hypothetical protein
MIRTMGEKRDHEKETVSDDVLSNSAEDDLELLALLECDMLCSRDYSHR